ncbi:MAG TPA: cyanophycin synthetase [Patescibacteria group bacterium]|nr:cyanophycin synthetase [Patescibacteria group bacterium]
MLQHIKHFLYFPVASYFRFFASIQLHRWHPTVIVATGSSGKTTLLHLIEAQLGHKARYSHHANSIYGIPFDILGLSRKSLTRIEWLYLFFATPFRAFRKPYREPLYVVEADADRPNEAKLLAYFLKPAVTLWTGVSKTHTMNFDALVEAKKFLSVEDAIGYEFGYFAQTTKDVVIANGENIQVLNEIKRTRAQKIFTTKHDLKQYQLTKRTTTFRIKEQTFVLPFLLPEETYMSLAMVRELLLLLNLPLDPSFRLLTLPPGRSSVFAGIKQTTIIDSSYNATPEGTKTILSLYTKYPAKEKWAVLGDMIELGGEEKEEHEKLAEEIAKGNFDKIILVGTRVTTYTYPVLHALQPVLPVVTFEQPKDVLVFLLQEIKGNETILFKGARFLEGIIEHLLIDKRDFANLCRREKIWHIRRKQWRL